MVQLYEGVEEFNRSHHQLSCWDGGRVRLSWCMVGSVVNQYVVFDSDEEEIVVTATQGQGGVKIVRIMTLVIPVVFCLYIHGRMEMGQPPTQRLLERQF